MIDSRTGKAVESIMNYDEFGKVKIIAAQYNNIAKYNGDLTLLHNHPNSSRPSYTDLLELREKNIDLVIAVEHDGMVYRIYDFNKEYDIEKNYNEAYTDFRKYITTIF